jgi:hypothetical protein
VSNPKAQIPKPHKKQKPFDIRERLFVFACDIVDVAQKLPTRGPIAGSLSIQLVSAAVSAASNAEEAEDGSSGKDFRAKERICLREIIRNNQRNDAKRP